MNDMKKLVKELVETQALAKTDLEALPWQTRNSVTNMVREAQERLEKLKSEYQRQLRANTLGVFLLGSPTRVAQFLQIAAEEAGMNTIQGDKLYQDLADKIEGTLGASREFGPTQLGHLHLALSDLMKTQDIRWMPMPKLQASMAVPDRDALVQYVRKLVRSALGDDLLRLVIDRRINELAIEQQFAGKIFPVAVVGLEADEIPSLVPIFSISSTVQVGDTSEDGDVNKEYVLNHLSALRKKVKNKVNNESV
jgi:hypothetical protein